MRNKSTITLRAASGLVILAALLSITGCSGKKEHQAPPPLTVSVIKTVAEPVTLYEEFVGQTEAVDTVEIRARVSGILERQAFEDGGRVKKNDLLFVIDRQPYIAALAQARAALAQAQAAHLNSRQNLDRIRPLLAAQAISQQDLDNAIAREAADAANVDAGKAQVRTAELNLEYTTIRAPRNGVISKALVKPGSLVNASTTLLTTLYSMGQIYVNFAFSEQKLLELQRELKHNPGDDKAKLPPFHLKLADGSDYKYSGKLNYIDAAVDPKSGTVQVRLTVPNPDNLLRAGQLVRVISPSLLPLQAIRVPQSAVQELQGKHSVYVVDAESKAEYREIVTSIRAGNDWVVESGLKPGEMVIVEGTQKVRPGTPVKPVVAAADGNGGKPDAAGNKAAPDGATESPKAAKAAAPAAN